MRALGLEGLVANRTRVVPQAQALGHVRRRPTLHRSGQRHAAHRLVQRSLALPRALGRIFALQGSSREALPRVELRGAQPAERLPAIHAAQTEAPERRRPNSNAKAMLDATRTHDGGPQGRFAQSARGQARGGASCRCRRKAQRARARARSGWGSGIGGEGERNASQAAFPRGERPAHLRFLIVASRAVRHLFARVPEPTCSFDRTRRTPSRRLALGTARVFKIWHAANVCGISCFPILTHSVGVGVERGTRTPLLSKTFAVAVKGNETEKAVDAAAPEDAAAFRCGKKIWGKARTFAKKKKKGEREAKAQHRSSHPRHDRNGFSES